MIRAVIFDCFGVLCHGSLNYLRSLTPPEHLQEFNDLSHSSDYGYITQQEYAEQVGLLLGCSASEINDIIRAQCVRDERVIQFASSLHGTYKIAMLSNVGRGLVSQLFTPEELDMSFDAVVLSSEVGIAKPSDAIYELTAQRLGLQPDECVMIDDIDVNVAGAESVGMKGIVFENLEQCGAALEGLRAVA